MEYIYVQPKLTFLNPDWGKQQIKVHKTSDKIEFIDIIYVKEFDKKKGWKTRSCAGITIIDDNDIKTLIKKGFN